MLTSVASAQITDVVVLKDEEASRLRTLIKTETQARFLYDSIYTKAKARLNDEPKPLKQIFYEGLLDNDPRRIETVKGLKDVDHVVDLIYSYYGDGNAMYLARIKQLVCAWAANYIPDGNTINENKLVPFFWAFHLVKTSLSTQEYGSVSRWKIRIAEAQQSRVRTPNNNWEAKRLKIIGTVGLVMYNDDFKNYALEGMKSYISTAYYPDSTSNDLRQRDALHYHIGGLKPTVAFFVGAQQFDPAFNLFDYVSSSGSSIRKSVIYTLGFATGQRSRKEWTNSKVGLDKKRAEAGLAKYQPGVLFEPVKAVPLFEWAAYYNRNWYRVLQIHHPSPDPYQETWIGLLNSPLVRNKPYSKGIISRQQ